MRNVKIRALGTLRAVWFAGACVSSLAAGCIEVHAPSETATSSTSTAASVPTSPVSAGQVLWLDADHAASFTLTGALVDQWADRSGQANHAVQVTAGARPTRTDAALNGRAVLTFDGTNDFLRVADAASLRPATAMTLFLVGKANTAGTTIYDTFIQKTSNEWTWADGWSLGSAAIVFADDFQFFVNRYHLAGNFTGNARVSLDVQHIWGGRYDATNLEFWADGALAATEASSGAISQSMRAMTIGAAYGTTLEVATLYFLSGQIAEILIYERALTDTEREDVEGYLAEKWGLRSSLPGGHRWR